MATTPASRAKIGARYMTPRNSVVTVIAAIGDQVQLENGAAARFMVPGTYPLTIMDDDRPPLEAPIVGLPLDQLTERLTRKPGQAGYLDDADLEDLADHDQRIEVAELVTGELERRAAPPETEAVVDQAAAELGAPALFTPPPSTPPAPAPGSTASVFGDATSVEARERVIRSWTTLDQVEAARALPGLQGTVIRDLDAQARYLTEAATAAALEDPNARARALQDLAAMKRLADRPGVLARVRELIAAARGDGATVVPSVTAAPPALELEGDGRPTELDVNTCPPEDRPLLVFLAERYPFANLTVRAVDLATVKALIGNVRDSRAALKSTTDGRLVALAVVWAEQEGRPSTIVGQLEARVKALGADATLAELRAELEADATDGQGDNPEDAAAVSEILAETTPEAGGRSAAYMAGRDAFAGGRYGSCSEAQADPELRDLEAEDFERGWADLEALTAEEPAYVKPAAPALELPALTEGQASSPWAILHQVNTIRSSAEGAVAHLVGLVRACENARALELAYAAETGRKATARGELLDAIQDRLADLAPAPMCGALFSHTGHPCTLAPHAGRDHLYEPDQVGWTAPPVAKAPPPESMKADPAEAMAILAVSGASRSELLVLELTEARPAVLAAIRARLVELEPRRYQWTAEGLETLDRNELLNLLEEGPEADQEALIRARLDVIDPPAAELPPAPVEDLSGLSLAEALNTGRLTLARALELVELATLPELLALPGELRDPAGVSSVVGEAMAARIRLLTPPAGPPAPSITETEGQELHRLLVALEGIDGATLRPWDGVALTPAEARRVFREATDGPGEFREAEGRPFLALLEEARAAVANLGIGLDAPAPEAPPAPPAAIQVRDLVVVQLPDGTADLWARPPGHPPRRLGRTDAPHLGEAMRLYAAHLAELEAAAPPPAPPAPPSPQDAIRALVAAVADALAFGVRVEIKITPETRAP